MRWRFANATLRRGVLLDRLLARRRCRRRRPTPRGSRSPRTPVASGRSARGARRPRRRGLHRTGLVLVPRSAARCSSRSTSRPIHVSGPSIPTRTGPRAVAAQLGDLEGTDDAPRVGQVDLRGKGGGRRLQPGGKGFEAFRRELRLETCTDGRIIRQCVEVEPASDRTQVETGAADQQRHAVLCRHVPRARRSRGPRSRRRRNARPGRRGRGPACGTRARSATGTLAVPISRPR